MASAGEDRGRSPLLPPAAPAAFHLLAKPTGAVCNLDCTYCFFLSKEMLYPGSRFQMADDLLETYLRQLIKAHTGAPEVVVAWQGGEPTMMGLDFFRRSVELADAMKRPGQRIVHTIQTNGILLDDAWGPFFAEHGFLVGLSIDGPQQIHDTYRVNKAGRGSFGQVMNGLDALRRHGVQWNGPALPSRPDLTGPDELGASPWPGRDRHRQDHCPLAYLLFRVADDSRGPVACRWCSACLS